MYIEIDGDEVAVTYIKDVVLNANRQDVEMLRMTKVSVETYYFYAKYSLCYFSDLKWQMSKVCKYLPIK